MPRVMNTTKIITALREFFAKERRLPGYNEMLRIFGYRSKNSVFQALRMLEDQGYIVKGPTGKIAPTAKLDGSVRILGTVQAGIPVDAEQLADAPSVQMETFLAPHPERSFLLEVRGDSMVDAAITEGDYVLVEARNKANVGDIVVANVDGEWTLKYLDQDADGLFLRPGNAKYKPIRATRTLSIAGVVRAVVRRYRS